MTEHVSTVCLGGTKMYTYIQISAYMKVSSSFVPTFGLTPPTVQELYEVHN